MEYLEQREKNADFFFVLQAETFHSCHKSHDSVQGWLCQQIWNFSGQGRGMDEASFLYSFCIAFNTVNA